MIIKLFLLLDFPGPFIMQDEFEFKQNAFLLFSKWSYFDFHLTPFYSIFLIPSFLFNNFYLVMKISNIFITSLVVYPVYSIANQVGTRNSAILTAFLSQCLPFQFVFPNLIMSENLFLFLFLLTVYFLLKSIENDLILYDIIFAFLLGFCYLTRYFAIVLFPVFLLAWWLRVYPFDFDNLKSLEFWKPRLLRFSLVCFISFSFFLFWTVISFREISYLAKDYFNPALLSQARHLTIHPLLNLSAWFLRYFLYFVLMVLPFGTLILMQLFTKHKSPQHKRFLFLILLISFGMIGLATWHMRETNLETSGLRGRYIIYLSFLWLLYAFSGEVFKSKVFGLKIGLPITIILLFLMFQQLILVKGKWFAIDSGVFFQSFNVPELYLFYSFPNLYPTLVIFANLWIFLPIARQKFGVALITLPALIFSSLGLVGSMDIFLNKTYIANLDVFRRIEKVESGLIRIYNNSSDMNHRFFIERYFPFFNISSDRAEIVEINDVYNVKKAGFLVSELRFPNQKELLTTHGRFVYSLPFPKEKETPFIDLYSKFPEAKLYGLKDFEAPWGKSIFQLPNRILFMSPETKIEYQLNFPKRKMIEFESFVEYHTLSKNWNVSDGAFVKVLIKKNKEILLERSIEIKPEDNSRKFSFAFQNETSSSLTFSIETTNLPGKNTDGDWIMVREPMIR
ncbi:glycosyltransferase family 39 protein [Leptospira ryugenii]|uniref:glycosyltransferase family 39 protein n=1 Tax=Leptospira ryugenii TaxID=1917863 RepID=UPI0014355258|nr:glycosyltransferase family 39 protein [Leptospira ryugenii]